MKMFYRNSQKRLKWKIGGTLLTIVGITIILFSLFSSKATPKLIHLAQTNINKYVDHLASDYQKIIVETEDLNILTIKENNCHEITSMNYDMNKVYKIAENLTLYLEENISSQPKLNEYLQTNTSINSSKGLVLTFHLGQISDSIFLSNLGPKIPILIHFIDSVRTNVKTTVTDYGINNALLNISLEVKLSYEIVTPITEQEQTLEYSLLLDSQVIQGEVPNIYGGYLEDKSAFLELPFNP